MEYKVRYQTDRTTVILTAFYGSFEDCVNVAREYISNGYTVSIEPVIRAKL